MVSLKLDFFCSNPSEAFKLDEKKAEKLFKELRENSSILENNEKLFEFINLQYTYYIHYNLYEKAFQLINSYKSFFLDKNSQFHFDINLKLAELLTLFGLKNQALFVYKNQLELSSELFNTESIKIKILYLFIHNNLSISHLKEWIECFEENIMDPFYLEKKDIKISLFIENNQIPEAKKLFDYLIEEFLLNDKIFELIKIYAKYYTVCIQLNEFDNLIKISKTIQVHFKLSKNLNLDNKYKFYEAYIQTLKIQRDFKKAFKLMDDLEILYKEIKHKKSDIEQKAKNLNFNSASLTFLEKQIKSLFFKTKSNTILIKDYNGNNQEIEINEIIYIQSFKIGVRVYLINDVSLYCLNTISEVAEMIENYEEYNKLFIFIKARSTFVNLFWMSKYDKIKKTLALNVLGQEFILKVSRRQSDDVLKLLKLNE